MCAMRHGRAEKEDGKAKLFAYCPFVGKGTPAVPGQRVGTVVAANVVSAPVASCSAAAKAQVLVLASIFFLSNSKRGPPSISFQS